MAARRRKIFYWCLHQSKVLEVEMVSKETGLIQPYMVTEKNCVIWLPRRVNRAHITYHNWKIMSTWIKVQWKVLVREQFNQDYSLLFDTNLPIHIWNFKTTHKNVQYKVFLNINLINSPGNSRLFLSHQICFSCKESWRICITYHFYDSTTWLVCVQVLTCVKISGYLPFAFSFGYMVQHLGQHWGKV